MMMNMMVIELHTDWEHRNMNVERERESKRIRMQEMDE